MISNRHKNHLFQPLVTAALLLLAACATQRNAAPPDITSMLAPQRGQTWQLVAIGGKELPLAQRTTTLVFDDETMTINGRTQCNTYTATYSLRAAASDGGADRFHITIGKPTHGGVECPEAGMRAEERYLATLPKTTLMAVTATVVTFYQNNKETLRYELL